MQKKQQVLTQHHLQKINLYSLKLDVDKLNIGNSKTVLSNLNILKFELDKLNVNKLKLVPVDL